MWLVNANVVDVVNGKILERRSIEITNGVIKQVNTETPKLNEEVFDVGGKFILPGIISCHTHLSVVFPFSQTDENENPAVTAFRAAKRARQALYSGITTIRCVHEQNKVDLFLKAAIKNGWSESPRIFGAGRAISTPNGHGAGSACSYAEGFDGFYNAAVAELRAGADHIKIFINGGLARAGEAPDNAEMTDEEIAGTVKAASENNTYVVAHSGENKAIMQALRQGVRSFEHIYKIDETTASALASAKAFVTPTLCVTRSESWMRANSFEEASIQNALKVSEQHLDSVKLAIKAKNQMVNGTDYPPGDSVDGIPAALYELFLMFGAGLTPLEALQSISITAARLLRQEKFLGQVAPNFAGDLISVESNPLMDMDTLRNIGMIMQSGRLIKDSAAS